MYFRYQYLVRGSKKTCRGNETTGIRIIFTFFSFMCYYNYNFVFPIILFYQLCSNQVMRNGQYHVNLFFLR